MGRIKPAALLLQSKRKKAPARFGIKAIAACNVVIILFLLIAFMHNHRKGKQGIEMDNDLVIDRGGDADSSSQYAVLNTTKGLITLQLYGRQAPKTVLNFVTHSKNGYYNGVTFHRIIKGFMIQGGDPQGDGYGGQSIWGGTFNDEFGSGLTHEPFTLSMANTGSPNSNGSQFFITTVGTPHLDNKHTVFGRVVSGKEVVLDIEDSPTSSSYVPLTPVVIHDIQIRSSP